MSIMFGSARHDENGKYTGGKDGDSLQTSSTNDTKGEVSMQVAYKHTKGFYIIRAKKVTHANSLASAMKTACNNKHIGYDQNDRLAIISVDLDTEKDVDCDCSSLVRKCVITATGKDPGNFTTANEKEKLLATGLFDDKGEYSSSDDVYNGDILVTKTKGHTVIVVSGRARSESSSSSSSTSSSSSSSTSSSKEVTATEAAKSGPDSTLSGTYSVTASSGLNIRNGAGTTKKKLVSIPKGTNVKCYGYYTKVSGVKWLYVQFTYNGVKYTGFGSSQYLKKK